MKNGKAGGRRAIQRGTFITESPPADEKKRGSAVQLDTELWRQKGSATASFWAERRHAGGLQRPNQRISSAGTADRDWRPSLESEHPPMNHRSRLRQKNGE